MLQQQPDQHMLSALIDAGRLSPMFICKAQKDLWTQKSWISLWGEIQKVCPGLHSGDSMFYGVVLFSAQSLSQPLRTRWTFPFACHAAEGSCNSVRGEIRTKMQTSENENLSFKSNCLKTPSKSDTSPLGDQERDGRESVTPSPSLDFPS